MPAWNDKTLEVASDDRVKAHYRLKQSWYRERVLGVPEAGAHLTTKRVVGSMLPADATSRRPALNFLSDSIAAYAETRAGVVKTEGGTLEEDRLRRNMLSSMPLCFNLFGHLKEHPVEAASVLSAALALDVAEVTSIEVEFAPPRTQHLRDRTAFDAFVTYRGGDGKSGFLGVETKYTEPFSATEYDKNPAYRALTADPGSGFLPGAAERLIGSKTNQLWRNCLLALSLRKQGQHAHGHVVVVALAGDKGAASALEGVRKELTAPALLLRDVTLEDLNERFSKLPSMRRWADRFRTRYLDLPALSRTRTLRSTNPETGLSTVIARFTLDGTTVDAEWHSKSARDDMDLNGITAVIDGKSRTVRPEDGEIFLTVVDKAYAGSSFLSVAHEGPPPGLGV